MTNVSPAANSSISTPAAPVLPYTDLPAAQTKRWLPQRKAEVVSAIREGRLTLNEACERYTISPEELLSWHTSLDDYGVDGLTRKMVGERRKSGRRAVRESGTVLLNTAERRECTITDIGKHGARLEVSSRLRLPSTFDLRCASTGRSLTVTMVWQRGPTVGVRFENSGAGGTGSETDLGAWLLGEDAAS